MIIALGALFSALFVVSSVNAAPIGELAMDVPSSLCNSAHYSGHGCRAALISDGEVEYLRKTHQKFKLLDRDDSGEGKYGLNGGQGAAAWRRDDEGQEKYGLDGGPGAKAWRRDDTGEAKYGFNGGPGAQAWKRDEDYAWINADLDGSDQLGEAKWGLGFGGGARPW